MKRIDPPANSDPGTGRTDRDIMFWIWLGALTLCAMMLLIAIIG